MYTYICIYIYIYIYIYVYVWACGHRVSRPWCRRGRTHVPIFACMYTACVRTFSRDPGANVGAPANQSSTPCASAPPQRPHEQHPAPVPRASPLPSPSSASPRRTVAAVAGEDDAAEQTLKRERFDVRARASMGAPAAPTKSVWPCDDTRMTGTMPPRAPVSASSAARGAGSKGAPGASLVRICR